MNLPQVTTKVRTPVIKAPLLLIANGTDAGVVPNLYGIITKHFTVVRTVATNTIQMRTAITLAAKSAGTTFVATTSFAVLKLINPHLAGTANDNIGTVLTFQGLTADTTLRIILLPELKSTWTQNSGTFVIDHFLSKLAQGAALTKDYFRWEWITPSNLANIAFDMERAFLIAVDIETSRDGHRITSCAYTAGYLVAGTITTRTYVVRCEALDFPFCIDAIQLLNSTSPPKVMQNGQYDSSYFLRFDCPLNNWLYDTYNMFHCIYPELPKDLAYMSSFFLDNYIYWKDESGTNLYEYNGKDTHNTFWLWLAQIRYAPSYAITNYLMEFPVVFPCLTCAMEGFAADETMMAELHASESAKKETARADLAYLLDEPNFNPASFKQVGEMFHALGYTVAQGTDKKAMTKFKETSLIYEPIADLIKDYRTAAKAVSTYFELELFGGRLLYALDPAGTDSGRLASKSSAFWCGTQIQNIPPYARVMYHADPGYILGAVDKAQAESYCTGYIAQEPGLIHAVTTSPDFHSHNASMFFGIPFNELYDAATHRKIRKDIRDIAKRVNHGANYNMGPDVLLETMGTREVLNAKRLLQLPGAWPLKQVCVYLLTCFDKAYPRIRGDWQGDIISEVIRTGKLTLEYGWTRRTFLKPAKSKLDLNSAMAHKPQCQSVLLVNKAFCKILHELQLKKYPGKFRLKAQVHDEIVFQATPDIMDTALQEVADIMTIPIKINGKVMTIPSTTIQGHKWSELKD